jgi:hypothetical protein
LVLLVHLQKNRIRLKEIEIMALAGMDEKNGDALQGMVSSYRKMLFPGSADIEETQREEMERRKAALAREAQKAFIVKPVDIKKVMQRAQDNPEYGKLAGRALAEHERKRMADLRRKAKDEQQKAARRRWLKDKTKRKK